MSCRKNIQHGYWLHCFFSLGKVPYCIFHTSGLPACPTTLSASFPVQTGIEGRSLILSLPASRPLVFLQGCVMYCSWLYAVVSLCLMSWCLALQLHLWISHGEKRLAQHSFPAHICVPQDHLLEHLFAFAHSLICLLTTLLCFFAFNFT
jgi:hypothetical protein